MEASKLVNDFTEDLLADLDALLVTKPENVRYLTGFEHPEDAWVWVDGGGILLVTTPLYANPLRERTLPHAIERPQRWPELLRERARGRVGFEAAHLPYARARALAEAWPEAELMPTEGRVEALRRIKSEEEKSLIVRAMAIARTAFLAVRPEIRPGLTEEDFAASLECAMRRRGAEDRAFATIVASGTRGAYPHAGASDAPLPENGLVTVDWGARYRGYHSDVTRTLALGEPQPELARAHRAVREALEAALAKARPGVPVKELDQAAREVLAGYDLLDYYPHALGHGVGLEVHEAPRVAIESDEVLRPGMVITLEPGVYLPGLGGAREEELVWIGENGIEVLSEGM